MSKVLFCCLRFSFLYCDDWLLTAPFIGSGWSLAGTLVRWGEDGVCVFVRTRVVFSLV